MPYHSTSDLPDNIKHILPDHAQAIYKEAFNSAYEEYKKPDERRDNASREEVSHRVAWSAVKQSYHKDKAGTWRKKDA